MIQTYDIANGIAQYKDAPPQHYKLLEFTEKLVGPNNALVNSLDVWTDGISFILGRSFAASDKRDRFTLQIDINDIFDASGAYRHLDRSLFTFVHEYAHALTLNDTQIDIGKHDKNLFYFNHESFRPDSYLRAFYDAFWQPVGRDDASAYFLEHPESFVDQYASSDCNEDIAESFALFVLAAKQTGDSIAEQKINFFYRYPELVAERTRIREAFGIAGD